MANFRQPLKILLLRSRNNLISSRRLLNYTPIYYDGTEDPANIFLNKNVQNLLKSLTRVDYDKIFKRRKLGSKTLTDPEYKFMTDKELQEALAEAQHTAEELLQIPPIVKVRIKERTVLAEDPALQGLEDCRFVFTDITYGLKGTDRTIIVREPDGTLQEAENSVRHRMNQVYFPQESKLLKAPRMFESDYLENLLNRREYEYVLDRACMQFEPDDLDYQRVVSITYQHVNDSASFELLRSTRHFGALSFFLVWNKNIDNLLLDIIETLRIEEARDLVQLYSLMHRIQFEGNTPLEVVQDYIKKAANKKGALELALQAYKELEAKNRSLTRGIERPSRKSLVLLTL
ncbi:hypothetical protein ABEB36_002055 [Hypothenemus hampei]|uniref:28S ribosomal protein S22, mitochondrial n=1 Tax=Hypothenemus hampei TaxID=57062 RepID=A0ABD1F4E8_HYPHA